MKDKLIQQNEKKKLEKKQPRKAADKTDAGAKDGAKAAARAPRKRGENEEELLDRLEEMKFELKARDQEFELLRSRTEKLEAANTSLAKSLLDEKKSK